MLLLLTVIGFKTPALFGESVFRAQRFFTLNAQITSRQPPEAIFLTV